MLLGDRLLKKQTFPKIDALIDRLSRAPQGHSRQEEVNRTLLDCIAKAEEPCFLLAPVLDFIEKVDRKGILPGYTMNRFELWLNQHSGLSFEENLKIRGKIVGKWISRSDYQAFFPIGMNKVYEGTHFITAHKSPDLDTTIASFWGWVDAFGAKVGSALHVWNVPGGPPSSQIEIQWLFSDLFGSAVFSHLAKTKSALSLTAKDLLTQQGMVVKSLSDSVMDAEHEAHRPAIVIVDQDGAYLGDWRGLDVEGVRQVISLLSSCLRWFENHLHLHMISLFAKQQVLFDEVTPWLKHLFATRLEDCDPALEFSLKQRQEVFDFVRLVLGVEKGLAASFEEVGLCLAKWTNVPFTGISSLLDSIHALFDKKGHLVDNRPQLFAFLEKMVRALHEALSSVRKRLDKLDIVLKTKEAVFQKTPTFVSLKSEVDEIRLKMGPYQSLTVAHDEGGKLFPLGIIHAPEARKSILGTVSLRDFCNREEMTIPSYLDVISVIDHHKSSLQTFTPPFAIISDAQSSNTLVAKQAFEINDRYSLRGQSAASIETQLKERPSAPLLQRLLHKQTVAGRKSAYFIDPEREYIEYLHFLYGIFDDTDLLSKVSVADVECVASLLNRLKSLAEKKEVEVVAIDDLPRDAAFPRSAAARILQSEEAYSLYRKAYAHREKDLSEQIIHVKEGARSHFFDDTKEQNGCCRIGQAKLFAANFALFHKERSGIRKAWIDTAMRVAKEKPEVDLHIQMISTIVSAEEVFRGHTGKYTHQDEVWIWIPEKETAAEHLRRFLTAFQDSPGLKDNLIQIELTGSKARELASIFQESFLKCPTTIVKGEEMLAVIYCKAGSLNSRKAMVSPFLPKLTV